MIAVVGYSARQLSKIPGSGQVTSIATPGSTNTSGSSPGQFLIVLAVGALALLFPVLVFLATATRLAAARREQRFAAMRLIGATPWQVSMIAAVEAATAAVAGVVLGFVLFAVLRPALEHVPVTGAPFAPGDLSLSLADVLLVAIGVPAAAVAAAPVALRRVLISPLGVSRRVTPPAPRPARLVPLAAGLAWLTLLAVVGHPNGKAVVYADFAGFLLIMAGLITAGPWLTDVVIAASLLIAGCSLAVGVVSGVSDRKRPFSLLRLTGVPLGVLRRVVALEAALPLLVVAVLSVAAGLLGAELFLRSQLDVSLRVPGPVYFGVVIAGMVASLALIAATLPLIDRNTGPRSAPGRP